MVLALIFSLLIWTGDDPYTVILKDGKRMEVLKAPVQESGRAIVQLKNGDKVALPAGMIDWEKSELFNKEMMEKRETEKRKAELEEQLREEKAKAAADARQPVVIKKTDLPEYEEEASDASGLTATAAEIAAAEGAVTTTDAANDNTPYAKAFRSKDPVFVSAERRTRLPQGGYQVECDIKVNHVTGAENVVLSYKANFINQASESHTIEVTPQMIDYNQTVTVRFVLNTDDDIFRTEHGLEAEIQE